MSLITVSEYLQINDGSPVPGSRNKCPRVKRKKKTESTDFRPVAKKEREEDEGNKAAMHGNLRAKNFASLRIRVGRVARTLARYKGGPRDIALDDRLGKGRSAKREEGELGMPPRKRQRDLIRFETRLVSFLRIVARVLYIRTRTPM